MSIFAAASAWTSSARAAATGFQGVVKRHHFRGGAATHGSMFHRAPGSIGASSYPSRVVKGMRAAGHMGVDARDDAEPEGGEGRRGQQPAAGARAPCPGANGGYVVIRKAVAAKPEPQPQVEKPRRARSSERGHDLDVVNAQNKKVGSVDLERRACSAGASRPT